jgi:hypothetical protein
VGYVELKSGKLALPADEKIPHGKNLADILDRKKAQADA